MSPSRPAVLVVVNSLDFGGTERMLERLVVGLSASGVARFTVCSLAGDGPIGRRLRNEGIQVVTLGQGRGVAHVVGCGIIGVRRLLKAGRFDLIHSFLYRSHCAARLAKLSLRARTPIVSSERCLGDNRSRLLLYLNRITSHLSDRILTVSEAVKEKSVRRDGVPEAKVTVIRNGICIPTPNPAAGARLRRALGIEERCLVYLQLGRLHREKGPDIFLDALHELSKRSMPPWCALLVGDGPERAALLDQARVLDVHDRVVFAGKRGYVDPWIEASDLMVLASREEGLPVSALEAMARSKSVVATRVGGTTEVIRDGEEGLLVEPENPAELAAALDALGRDPARRRRLGERGRARVSTEFSIEHMLEAVSCCYREVLQAAPLRVQAASGTVVGVGTK